MVYTIRVDTQRRSLSVEGDPTKLELGNRFYGVFTSANPDTKALVLAYTNPFEDRLCEELQRVSNFIRQTALEGKVNVSANAFFDPRDRSGGTGVILSTQSD